MRESIRMSPQTEASAALSAEVFKRVPLVRGHLDTAWALSSSLPDGASVLIARGDFTSGTRG